MLIYIETIPSTIETGFIKGKRNFLISSAPHFQLSFLLPHNFPRKQVPQLSRLFGDTFKFQFAIPFSAFFSLAEVFTDLNVKNLQLEPQNYPRWRLYNVFIRQILRKIVFIQQILRKTKHLNMATRVEVSWSTFVARNL